MSVQFTDNTLKVQSALEDGVKAFLYEAAGELQAASMRNSRVDTGKTKSSYQYKVETKGVTGTAYIGSDFENAIYEEFGTGEYALSGGRKTPWTYRSSKDGKFYTTTGKKPNRPMYRAYNALKNKLEQRLAQILKGAVK